MAADTAHPDKLTVFASFILISGAIAVALFFRGPEIPLLAIAQVLLFLWLLVTGLQIYRDGLHLPKTALVFTVTLFWLWLGASLAWSRATTLSIISFWWVGGMALTFWIYTLSPQRDRIWPLLAKFLILTGVVLSLTAAGQVYLLQKPPVASFVYIHSFGAFLMLVALATAGYFLLASNRNTAKRDTWLLALAMFLMFFAIALTKGRGTTLCLVTATVILSAVAYRHVAKKQIVLLFVLMGFAYLLANLSLQGAVSDRLVTLADPETAGYERFRIWRASWEMLQDTPWYGIGLGAYYLAWPPYRHPEENTLGFFAHNDYLQLWIETGLPGLVLFIGVLLSVLWIMIRMLRERNIDVAVKIEASALFCGLLAVAAHSFIDFNLYVLPTLIVAGLVLGRFQELSLAVLKTKTSVYQPSSFIGKRAYPTILLLLVLFPVSYVSAVGFSDYYYKYGRKLAVRGELERADDAFKAAERLLPTDDKSLLSHGDLLRQSLALVPRTDTEYRRELYEQALVYLARAEQANPYRAMVFLIRAQLHQDNPEFAGEDWQQLAEEAYQECLRLNPLLVEARLKYAQLLVRHRNPEAAHRVLEAGVDYWYYLDAKVVAYYDYTLALRRQLGKTEMAQKLAPQVAKMKQDLANKIAEFVRAREQKSASTLSIPAYLKPGFWE